MPTFLFSRQKNRPSAFIDVFLSGVTVLPRRVLAASSPTQKSRGASNPLSRVLVVPLSFHCPSANPVEMFTAEPVIDGTHQPQLLQLLGVQPSRMGPHLKLLSRSVAALFGEGLREIAVDLLFFLIVILGIPIKCKVKLRQIAKTKRHLFTISLDLQSNCNSHTKAELKREKKHCQDELQFL